MLGAAAHIDDPAPLRELHGLFTMMLRTNSEDYEVKRKETMLSNEYQMLMDGINPTLTFTADMAKRLIEMERLAFSLPASHWAPIIATAPCSAIFGHARKILSKATREKKKVEKREASRVSERITSKNGEDEDYVPSDGSEEENEPKAKRTKTAPKPNVSRRSSPLAAKVHNVSFRVGDGTDMPIYTMTITADGVVHLDEATDCSPGPSDVAELMGEGGECMPVFPYSEVERKVEEIVSHDMLMNFYTTNKLERYNEAAQSLAPDAKELVDGLLDKYDYSSPDSRTRAHLHAYNRLIRKEDPRVKSQIDDDLRTHLASYARAEEKLLSDVSVWLTELDLQEDALLLGESVDAVADVEFTEVFQEAASVHLLHDNAPRRMLVRCAVMCGKKKTEGVILIVDRSGVVGVATREEMDAGIPYVSFVKMRDGTGFAYKPRENSKENVARKPRKKTSADALAAGVLADVNGAERSASVRRNNLCIIGIDDITHFHPEFVQKYTNTKTGASGVYKEQNANTGVVRHSIIYSVPRGTQVGQKHTQARHGMYADESVANLMAGWLSVDATDEERLQSGFARDKLESMFTPAVTRADLGSSLQIVGDALIVDGVQRSVYWGALPHSDISGTISVDKNERSVFVAGEQLIVRAASGTSTVIIPFSVA